MAERRATNRSIPGNKMIAGSWLRTILGWNWLRKRVAFALRQSYYEAFEIRVPLVAGLTAPVVSQEAWLSFSEIFLQGEYAAVWRAVPLPDRWIDLGCHAGYFSLYCEQQR